MGGDYLSGQRYYWVCVGFYVEEGQVVQGGVGLEGSIWRSLDVFKKERSV